MMSEAYIYDALRTPRGKGKASGALYEVKPINLLTTTLRALEQRNQLDTSRVDDVLIGCVTPTDEQGYNIAKAAVLFSNWSDSVSAMQINRFCASGLEAVNLAAMKVRSGWEQLVVAGGVESMSRVPMGSDSGPLLYDPAVLNKVRYLPQGTSADLIATLENFDREAVDTYALGSQQRTQNAIEKGFFKNALIPLIDPNGLPILERDEHPRPNTSLEALAALPPVFTKDGQMGYDQVALYKYPELECINHVHTAGNSSGIVDGAALVLIGSKSIGEQLALQPRARIIAMANISVDPTIMLTGPAPAARKALQQAGLTPKDIDLWECNEAFAAVVLKFQKEMKIKSDQLNVNGGAIALGHPLGATGAMLVGTLLDELERRDLRRGLVTLCVGGGMGVATIIDRTLTP